MDEKVLYMYRYDEDDFELGLIGSHECSNHGNLASINDLKREINSQKIELINGEHADGYIIPWDGILVCKEGVFSWNKELEDYVMIGKITDNNEIVIYHENVVVKKKYAVIKECHTLYLPSDSDEEYAEFHCSVGEAYEVIGEFAQYIGLQPVLSLVVKVSDDYSPIVIPASKVLIADGVNDLERVRELI